MKVKNNFYVGSVDSLLDIIESENIDRFSNEVITYNQSSIYRISNGRIVLIPAIGNEGIVFENELIFREMLIQKYFPVQNNGSVFALERKKIEKFEENKHYYIERLVHLTGFQLSIDDGFKNLEDLSKAIKLLKSNSPAIEELKELTFCLGVYLGEIIRVEYKTCWKFEPYFTLNPYWIPVLENSNDVSFNLWNPIDDFIFTNMYIDLRVVVERIITKQTDII